MKNAIKLLCLAAFLAIYLGSSYVVDRQKNTAYETYLLSVFPLQTSRDMFVKEGDAIKVNDGVTRITVQDFSPSRDHYSIDLCVNGQSRSFLLNRGPTFKSIVWGDADLSLLEPDLPYVIHFYEGRPLDKPRNIRYTVSRKEG